MLRMYPRRTWPGQDFTNAKIFTVPDQSMTLREIIRRFLRKESLPVEKDGVYIDGLGDLEKASKADLFTQAENAKYYGNLAKSLKPKPKAVESAPSGVPPLGDVTGAPVGAQAPPPVSPTPNPS